MAYTQWTMDGKGNPQEMLWQQRRCEGDYFHVLTIHFHTALDFSPHSIQDLSIFNDSHFWDWDEAGRKKKHFLSLQRNPRDTKGLPPVSRMWDEQD